MARHAEGGSFRHRPVQSDTTEPSVVQVEVNLLAQRPLRAYNLAMASTNSAWSTLLLQCLPEGVCEHQCSEDRQHQA